MPQSPGRNLTGKISGHYETTEQTRNSRKDWQDLMVVEDKPPFEEGFKISISV